VNAPLSLPPSGVEGLEGRRFDAVVVGGGVLGVGVARELAQRGRSCLLVERRDLGSGTTARSTRLIHGGLRYLATYDFGVVREGLRERAWLLRAAPNLVTPLLFILPFYGAPLWQRLRLRAGLILYDLLAGRRGLPGHQMASPRDAVALEPALRADRLQLAGLYWDAQVELPERMVVEAARAAAEAGATVRVHVGAGEVRRQGGRVSGLELVSEDGGRATVWTQLVLNATGPWADEALSRMGVPREPMLRLVQGAHLVFPRLSEHAVAFEHPDDGRLCFTVPWQGATLVGTTETDIETIDSAGVRTAEADYLARAASFVFPAAAEGSPWWAIAGVRALPRSAGVASRVSRRHLLVDHRLDGVAGLWTAVGGKLTAWRSIAAEVVGGLLGQRGSSEPDGSARSMDLTPPGPQPDASAGPVEHRLWRLYGGRADEVRGWTERDPWWGEALVPGEPAIRAEVAHAASSEWAASLPDLVFRRLCMGFGPDLGAAAAEEIALLGVQRLGWDEPRLRREREAYVAEVEERRLPVRD
jgi:glycerol-3-phosphate dehydrogenase